MIRSPLDNSYAPFCTDCGNDPVAGYQYGGSVSTLKPNYLQTKDISVLPCISLTCEETGMMPDNWFLDPPGVSPYAGLKPEEAVVLKQIENLFYSSFCMVLAVGDMVNQTTAISLKGKKAEINANMNKQLGEIQKKYAALRKQQKNKLINKILRWAAVAVTAIICVAATVLTGGAAAPVAAALFALTLTVAIMEETGGMEKLTKAVGDLLKKLGVDEKNADLIAGILVAVVIAIVMIAVSLCMPGGAGAAATQIATSIQRAAQLAMRAAEVANGALAVGTGVTAITGGMAKKEELLSKARMNEINAITKSFEEQVQELLDEYNDNQQRTEETKQLLIEAIKDVMETTRSLINDAMGINSSGSGLA